MHRTYVKVRCGPSHVQRAWPALLPSFKKATHAAYDTMHAIAARLASLAMQGYCNDAGAMDLFESAPFDTAEELSMSNLSAFHYQFVVVLLVGVFDEHTPLSIPEGFLRQSVHCPYHTGLNLK